MTPPLHQPAFQTARAGVLLVILVIAAHAPAIVGGFVWDDDDNLTRNEAVRSPAGLGRIWLDVDDVPPYYPLARSALWLQHAVWGLNPLGYHLVSVLLQALNVLLLWRILRRLDVPAAWFAAAVFGIHPLQVESVAWITEQKNLLSATLVFGATLAWLRFRSPQGRKLDWRPYAVALALFVTALLAKTTTSCFPLAVLLIAWWKRGRIERIEALAVLPMFAVGGALGMLTAWLERNVVGAMGPSWDMPWIEKLLIAARAGWFYPIKLVWPQPLLYIYPKWSIDRGEFVPYLVLALALAAPCSLWLLRKRIGRGPFAAVAIYGVAIAPALGFVNVYYMRYAFVADRWQYLPGIPLIALAAAGGSKWLARRPLRSAAVGLGALALLQASGFVWALVLSAGAGLAAIVLARRFAGVIDAPRAAAAAVVLASLGLISFRASGAFQNEETLWRRTLAGNPSAAVAHHNLGGLLLYRGDTAEALDHFESAAQFDPGLAETRNNLGIALYRLGRGDESIAHYRAALELDPDFADAHTNLGISLFDRSQWDEALEHFFEAVRLRPDLASARVNLGAGLLQRERVQEAAEHLVEAVRLDPEDVQVRLQAAVALVHSGRGVEAVTQLKEAIRRAPQLPEAWDLLADAYAAQGRLEDAVAAATRGAGLARQAGNEPLARRLADRAKAYRSRGAAPNIPAPAGR